MATSGDNKYLIRAIIASHFAPPFMFSGVAIALPDMATELGAGATSLSLVETLFLAANLAFLLPTGRLADASDKRTLYKLGLFAFGLTSALIGLLSSMPVILAMRVLQGVASSVLSATGAAILADLVPPERRGRAFGATLGVAYAGLSLGPICAGFLVHVWSWRAVFVVGAAALLAGSVFIHRMMPSSWRRAPGVVHLPSAGLLFAAVACLVAGTATIRHGAPSYAMLAGGLALAAVFVRVQRRLAAARSSSPAHPFASPAAVPPQARPPQAPLLDINALVQNRMLSVALLVQLLLYMSAFVSTFILSIFLQVSLHHSSRTAGRMMAIGSIIMAVLAPVFGRLADRVRPDRLATTGVACVLVTGVLATRLDGGTGLGYIALMLAFQGLGFALFSSPNMTIIMNAGSPARAVHATAAADAPQLDADAAAKPARPPASATAMTSALAGMSRALGMVCGMLIASLMISSAIGNDPVERHPAQFIDIATNTFTVLATLSALALLISLRERPQIRAAGRASVAEARRPT